MPSSLRRREEETWQGESCDMTSLPLLFVLWIPHPSLPIHLLLFKTNLVLSSLTHKQSAQILQFRLNSIDHQLTPHPPHLQPLPPPSKYPQQPRKYALLRDSTFPYPRTQPARGALRSHNPLALHNLQCPKSICQYPLHFLS